ncbi:MAG: hypothetical protein ACLRWQ_13935 [Flavonifractor plautii]
MIGLIVATSGDFGMALTYAFIFVIMAWAGGVKKRWFLLAIVVCVIGAVLIWPHISDKYFARRITVVIEVILLWAIRRPSANRLRDRAFSRPAASWLSAAGGCSAWGISRGFRPRASLESALPARHR